MKTTTPGPRRHFGSTRSLVRSIRAANGLPRKLPSIVKAEPVAIGPVQVIPPSKASRAKAALSGFVAGLRAYQRKVFQAFRGR